MKRRQSLGWTMPKSMRLIILPQALKISIPGIVNVAVGLFKDTTLGVGHLDVRYCRHDPWPYSGVH